MSHINLLPWRQDIVRYKNRLFGSITVVIVVVALGANLILAGIINVTVYAEQQKITTLDLAVQKNKEIIKEVNILKDTKQSLMKRNEIIQSLQEKKIFLTKLLNSFATIIPDGIQLSEISMTKQEVMLKGSSTNDSRIFTLLQNLESLPWIKSATFNDISKKEKTEVEKNSKKDQFTDNIIFIIEATIK